MGKKNWGLSKMPFYDIEWSKVVLQPTVQHGVYKNGFIVYILWYPLFYTN